MFKQAFRSYIASLHPRNFKKVKNDNLPSLSVYIFWIVVYPNIVGQSGIDADLPWGVYASYRFLKFIPALLMGWSNMCGCLPMPKMIYLSPMKEAERYKYIKSLMCIKIGVPVILGFILQLVWVYFFHVSILQVVVILFAYISIGIGTYVCSDLVNKHDRRITMAVRNKKGEPKEAWLNVAVMFVGIAILIALEDFDFLGLDGASGIIVFTELMMVLLIADIVILKTRYHGTLEDLCNYEISHRVLGKVKNA